MPCEPWTSIAVSPKLEIHVQRSKVVFLWYISRVSHVKHLAVRNAKKSGISAKCTLKTGSAHQLHLLCPHRHHVATLPKRSPVLRPTLQNISSFVRSPGVKRSLLTVPVLPTMAVYRRSSEQSEDCGHRRSDQSIDAVGNCGSGLHAESMGFCVNFPGVTG